MFRVQVAHQGELSRLGFGFDPVDVRDLVLVDHGAAQEARLVVVVIQDHFEHQRADLAAVAHQREQQPVAVVEPGAVETALTGLAELLDLGSAEIAAGDGLRHLAVGLDDLVRVEAGVFEDAHHVLSG